MFLLHCPACGQRELRGTRALDSLVNTPHGIEIAIGCSRCGTVVRTLTGARAAAPAGHHGDAAVPAGAAA